MCDQSKFNYLSGGLLAPRSFLILLSKDWKLLIVPLLYQGDVFRNMQAASCFQRVRTGKAIDHSILHKQRNPPQQPHYVHNRTVAHRQLPGATRVAQGTLTGIPVPYLHDTFLSPWGCLQWRRGSPLTSNTCWATALSWLHHPSKLSWPSTMLVEVQLWRLPFPSPSLAPKPPPLMQHSTWGPKPLPITHSRENSSHFVFPFQSTKTPCMRTYLPAWRRVAQTSPTGEQCGEHSVAIYMFSY